MKKPKNWLPSKKYFASLPKKCNGTAMVIKNSSEEILMEKVSYRNYWILPGGALDENESPKHAVEREVLEELGINISSNKLVGVMFLNKTAARPESMQFYFDGGILSDDQISKIKVDGDEIVDFKFVPQAEINKYTGEERTNVINELLEAINNSKTIYLEDWKAIL